MGVATRALRSLVVVSAGCSLVWEVLLDERARDSVRQARRVTSDLALYLLRDYMEPTSQYSSEQAARENREWVDQQWKNIGF